MALIPPPPVYTKPTLENGAFSPVWLDWMVKLGAVINQTAASGTLHNSLSGLDGGTTGEYYHLTSARYTTLTGNQTANRIFAGPASGAGAPATFRAMVTADLPAGTGTVTSVAQSFTGGLISVAGSPITTSGTLALTVAGTSGGIPYFSGATTWASSALLTANALLFGGGAGNPPTTPVGLGTTITVLHGNAGGAPTWGAVAIGTDVSGLGTGIATALAINTGSAGAPVLFNGALGTPSSGTATNLTGTAAGLSVGGTAAGLSVVLVPASGGTGVANNNASTLTISGSFATTLTVSGITGVTLPTSGTLSTLAGSEELTNKTLNASVGKGTWTASGTWTLPALTLGGAITYGGVALSNAVTGTGNMVLSANQTLTGTLTAAVIACTSLDSTTFVRSTGITAPGSGAGVELTYGSNNGHVLCYDRGGSLYKALNYDALSHTIQVSGTGIASFTSTGLNSTAIGATTPSTGSFTSMSNNGTLAFNSTAPTISSGFGTSPSIASNNGSLTFRVNVGTGGIASSGVVGMPTAANGWNCTVMEFNPNATALLSVTTVTATTTTSISVQNDLLSTGAATAWQASQVLVFICSAY